MKHTLHDFSKEIQRELAIRRQVWRRIPGTTAQFQDPEHQKQYDTLDSLGVLEQMMTLKEFQAIKDRISRHEKEATAQTSLFPAQ